MENRSNGNDNGWSTCNDGKGSLTCLGLGGAIGLALIGGFATLMLMDVLSQFNWILKIQRELRIFVHSSGQPDGRWAWRVAGKSLDLREMIITRARPVRELVWLTWFQTFLRLWNLDIRNFSSVDNPSSICGDGREGQRKDVHRVSLIRKLVCLIWFVPASYPFWLKFLNLVRSRKAINRAYYRLEGTMRVI